MADSKITAPPTDQNSAPKTEEDVKLTVEKVVVEDKEKIEKKEEAAKVTVKNAEKKGTVGFGIAEKLKQKWAEHIEKNKEKAGKHKADEAEKKRELEELFEDFDPKRDKKKLTTEVRKRIIEAEKLYQEGISSIKDLVAPTSVEITPNQMKLNGMFVKSFFVFNYPRYLESNWLNPLINFDVTMDISIFVYPTEAGRMMKILRKKVAEMLSTKHLNQKRGLVTDVALETALEDAEQLRTNLQRGMERFFQVGLYFTLYAHSKEKLDTAAKQLETILGGQLVMTRSADFQVERSEERRVGKECRSRWSPYH